MKESELDRIVKSRRSIRDWEEREVPDELIEECIEMARWAPNGGNKQAWYLHIIKSKSVLEQIADAMYKTTRIMMSWPESEPYSDMLKEWEAKGRFFLKAPVALVLSIGSYSSRNDELLSARLAVIPNDEAALSMQKARQMASSRLQSAGALVQTLLLAFAQKGLGSCWMTGPVYAKDEVERIVGTPKDMDFVALIPFGYPKEKNISDRKPVSEIITYIR